MDRIRGGAIYFGDTAEARFAEPNLRDFATLREVAAFIRSIRSGWRYDYDNSRWTRVTRNHMIATIWEQWDATPSHPAYLVRNTSVRLDALPNWVRRTD